MESDLLPPLLLRVDATAAIGTGHLMRCGVLAQQWRSRGGAVRLVGRIESAAVRDRIGSWGCEIIPLASVHPDPADLHATVAELAALAATEGQTPWLILDGYHFDPLYQSSIRAAGYRLLVLDDMNHLPYYDADVLLNQNIGSEELSYRCAADTVQLLGGEYVLLREEFRVARSPRRAQPEVARKLLITMGGSDPKNVSLTVAEAVQWLEVDDLEAALVVGPSNPHGESLRSAVEKSCIPLRLVRNADMAELMRWADLAVAAAGSTCWELAYMSVPMCVMSVAENQEAVAAGLERAGAAVHLGSSTQLSPAAIARTIECLLSDPSRRTSMSEAGRRLVDGHGSIRVMNAIAHYAPQ